MLRGRALPVLLLVLLLPGGCAGVAAGILAADGSSIATIHRSVFDALYSAATGRDCSVVRLDRGETWCRPPEPPPAPPAYCTRSLGGIDCWRGSQGLGMPPPAGLAEGPDALSPAQERNRTARWPQTWLGIE